LPKNDRQALRLSLPAVRAAARLLDQNRVARQPACHQGVFIENGYFLTCINVLIKQFW